MDILDWMTAEETRIATLYDKHSDILSGNVLCSWPLTKAEEQKDLQLYWLFIDVIAIIDASAMKDKK